MSMSNGYVCTFFETINGKRVNRHPFIVLAKDMKEASRIVKGALQRTQLPEEKITYDLTPISVVS